MTIGAVAGYFGRWVDATLMRFTELFQAVPSFALAIVLVAIFQPSVASIVSAIALVSWPPVARLVRGEFLALRQRDFVAAAQLAGLSTPRIIVGQILPNAASPIVVMASLMVATAIDLTRFTESLRTHEGSAGRPAWDPQVLVSVWVYSYSEGISSARQIDQG